MIMNKIHISKKERDQNSRCSHEMEPENELDSISIIPINAIPIFPKYSQVFRSTAFKCIFENIIHGHARTNFCCFNIFSFIFIDYCRVLLVGYLHFITWQPKKKSRKRKMLPNLLSKSV